MKDVDVCMEEVYYPRYPWMTLDVSTMPTQVPISSDGGVLRQMPQALRDTPS